MGGRTEGRTNGLTEEGGRIRVRADGRTSDRADDGCLRPGGRAAGPILNDSMRKAVDPNLQSVDKPLARDIICQSRSAHGGRSEVLCIEVWTAPARVDGQTGGRADDGCPRPGGRAAGPILNDSATIFIDFHEKLEKNIAFFCPFAAGRTDG